MSSSLDTILEPGYLDDLASRPLEEVRARRDDCQTVETALSYLRRVVQGHIDIVSAERRRRREGGDPADLSLLVEQLPQILAENLRAPGLGRLPHHLDPGDVVPELQRELEDLGGLELSALPASSDDALGDLLADLEGFERRVSGLRRQLFDRIDALQGELTRRYRDGEASVESLLR